MAQNVFAGYLNDIRAARRRISSSESKTINTDRGFIECADIGTGPVRQKGLISDASVASSIPHYDLEHILVPTLIIAAEDDLYGTFERGRYSAEHIPGARFVSYPTGGHLLVGHRDDVRSELDAFLKGILKQAAAA